MKHLKKNRKFGRTADYRKNFLWNVVNSLILKEKIKTTEARAKEARHVVERAISHAKNDTLANRRLLLKHLERKTVNKLFNDLGKRFGEKSGGYLRILKTASRKNDGAKIVMIELIK